jgi:hydroxymethylglutaryl-CoA lyase
VSLLPERVEIREVGPRDGFQNEPETIPTADKLRLIGMLLDAGLKRIELTSFVRSDVIPQLSDAEDVLSGIEAREGVVYSALVPNLRGLDRALEFTDKLSELSFFCSATESHSRANVNRSIDESVGELEQAISRAGVAGFRCVAVVSVSFGCPYEGRVDPDTVFAIAERLISAGCEEIGFGDTTGMANPLQVKAFFEQASQRLDGTQLTAHFHNTRGQGLANALAALESGVASFESSFGELGGCPVPAGATGNIATEDLVGMFEEMGIATGVNVEGLVEASKAAQDLLGRPLGSHVLTAGPVDWSGPESVPRA